MVHIVFDNLSLAGVVDVFTNKLMDGLITTDGIFKTCGVDAMIVAWAPRRSERSQAKPCCKQEAEPKSQGFSCATSDRSQSS